MKRFLVVFGAVLMLLGLAGNGQATTLGDLLDGNDIVVGDKTFTSWLLIWDQGPYDNWYETIEVVGVDDPLNPGLRFTADDELSVTGRNETQLTFSYRVVTEGELPLIKDVSLALTDYEFGESEGGKIAITEDIEDMGGQVAQVGVQADNFLVIFEEFDDDEFDNRSWLMVETVVDLFGDFEEDEVGLYAFEQRFSQVPEPATMLLLGTGLVGLGVFGRKKFKKA